MIKVSYSDLFGINHVREQDEEIAEGDLVRTGPSQFPRYRVIAVNGERVWVRNADNGLDGVTDLNRCRRIERASPPAA
jgi:hypothetical protein